MQIVVQLLAPARLYWIDTPAAATPVASVAVALIVVVPRNIPGLVTVSGRARVVDDRAPSIVAELRTLPAASIATERTS